MLVKAKTGQRERLSYLRMNKTWKGWLKSPPASPSLPPSLPLLMAHLCLLSFNKKILNTFLGFFCSPFPLPWPMLSKNEAFTVRSWCFSAEWNCRSFWLLQQIPAVCMGLSLDHIRKNPTGCFLLWLVDPCSSLEENEPKFHKLDSVYIYMWKCMSKGSWNSRKFNEKWLSHICELKAQLELPIEALWKGSSGSHILNLETGLLEFRNVYSLCFVCVQFCMSLKVSHRRRSVK